MNELKQLYQLRDTQIDAITVTELAIMEMEQQNLNFDIDTIRAKLCGKTFAGSNYENTFYKILEISEVHTEGAYCTAIEIRESSATNNNSHVSNKQAYYSHDSNDIEINVVEFDAKFDKIVTDLISINLNKK